MDDDGFQLVSKKKAAKRTNKRQAKSTSFALKDGKDENSSIFIDVNRLKEEIVEKTQELGRDSYWHQVKDIVRATVTKPCCSQVLPTEEIPEEACSDHKLKHPHQPRTDSEDVKEMVCYGVGNFASCLIARHQLMLGLLLRDELKVSKPRSYIYDPVFSAAEITVLQGLGCFTVLDINEEGKRPVTERTLFYMPHCGKALYNNLLWKNWNPAYLQNVMIVGNSFKYMHESTPRRILETEAGFILKILPYVEECSITNSFHHQDIFNNTSLHIFPLDKLKGAPEEMWADTSEPKYSEDVEIICSKMTDLHQS